MLHISWETVGNIIERVVQRTLSPDRLSDLFVIGIDEVSYRKGHKYLTVIVNHLSGQPVFITEGRTREAAGQLFDALGPERSAEVAVVTMDMAAPYIEEVKARAPNAEIAFDPFHVVKLANEAVQQVRRSERSGWACPMLVWRASTTRSASSSAAPSAFIPPLPSSP